MVNEVQPNGVGPGTMLKVAREARDMTHQDVSDSLNLQVRVIDDIESERWSQLPPAAFSRGYLRAYAKLLGLDQDAIVGAFDAAAGQTRTGDSVRFKTIPPNKGGIAELMQKQPGTVLTAAVALVICGVLIVLWAVWPDVSGNSNSNTQLAANTTPPSAAPKPVVQAGSEPTAHAASEPAASKPIVAAQRPPPNTKTSGAAAAPSAGRPAAASSAGSSPAPTGHAVVEQPPLHAAEPGGAHRITATGDDRLAFAFGQDCWVEVKDRQGRNIYSDLSRSGDSLELVGQAPFMIMLGYAPGVTLSFNGERVTLTPHTRNNVATLALGQ